MTIRYLDAKRIQGVSGDTKPTNVALNTVFEETDTRTYYFLTSSGWLNQHIAQYGYALGGNRGGSITDDVSRYAHASSTTGSKVGDLSGNNRGGGACENSDCTQMFLMRHHDGSSYVKTITKVIPSASVSVSGHGNIVTNGVDGQGCASDTHGYRAGGNVGGSYTNAIEKFAFSSNTNGTDVGNMHTSFQHGGAFEDDANQYGYYWGGYNGSGVPDIYKWSFATDGDASNSGADLSSGTVSFHGASANTTHAFQFGGRINNSSHTDDIQKYQINTSGNASRIGDMTVGIFVEPAISENTSSCWIAGGEAAGSAINDIRKFDFATDTTETDIGNLEATMDDAGGCNGNA